MSWLNPEGEARVLPAKVTTRIARGDALRHDLPGAGGWGDPLERDPARVLRDVRNGLVSGDAAREDGVVVDAATWTVGAAATERRRAALRAGRGWTTPPAVRR
jgi:N-methylhydantoinase B